MYFENFWIFTSTFKKKFNIKKVLTINIYIFYHLMH